MSIGIARRRPLGKRGGRVVGRVFGFAPMDGEKYPSESRSIREQRLPLDPTAQPSWTWAMAKMQRDDCWLAIPLMGESRSDRAKDANNLRASLWRSGLRLGIDLTSEVTDGHLFVAIAK